MQAQQTAAAAYKGKNCLPRSLRQGSVEHINIRNTQVKPRKSPKSRKIIRHRHVEIRREELSKRMIHLLEGVVRRIHIGTHDQGFFLHHHGSSFP